MSDLLYSKKREYDRIGVLRGRRIRQGILDVLAVAVM